jgi:hypothetical protein
LNVGRSSLSILDAELQIGGRQIGIWRFGHLSGCVIAGVVRTRIERENLSEHRNTFGAVGCESVVAVERPRFA